MSLDQWLDWSVLALGALLSALTYVIKRRK